MMVAALRAAAEDCTGAPPGGAGSGDRLLQRVDSVRVVSPLGWRVTNPAQLVAQRLGVEPAETVLSAIGGNMPQSLLHDGARAIAAGELDVVAVVGAECMYTRSAARRDPDAPALDWAVQPAGEVTEPRAFGDDRSPATDLEMARGMLAPVHVYPLFENALRYAAGLTLEEHRQRIGALWQRFSDVAAANPMAFIRRSLTVAEIIEPSPDNRMVAFPYPKLCTANMTVDQSAGYLLCSVEEARAAGLPEDRWIFPLGGADANDQWFVSHRAELHRSPAIRLAGAAALELAGVGIDDLAAVDLYSCFPCVVQIAAAELGLPLDDPTRPLTLTGGLTFFGGPGNNYTSHGIAALADRLRGEPGSVGMATGLGWYATKHAIGVYGSRPPEHEGREGFRWRNVQDDVDALPQCQVDAEATGEVTVETYTVTFDRDGNPERGIVAARTAEGVRAWGNVTDHDQMLELTISEGCGRKATLREGGVLSLT
jgi:acetyl-CoA C-acetyltransferase